MRWFSFRKDGDGSERANARKGQTEKALDIARNMGREPAVSSLNLAEIPATENATSIASKFNAAQGRGWNPHTPAIPRVFSRGSDELVTGWRR